MICYIFGVLQRYKLMVDSYQKQKHSYIFFSKNWFDAFNLKFMYCSFLKIKITFVNLHTYILCQIFISVFEHRKYTWYKNKTCDKV